MLLSTPLGWDWSYFSHQFFNVLIAAIQFISLCLVIVLLMFWSAIGAFVHSTFRGARKASFIAGARSFIRSASGILGLGFSAFVALILISLIGLSWLKVLLVFAFTALIVSFLIREAVFFILFQKFGKHIFYLASFERLLKFVYGKTKNEI